MLLQPDDYQWVAKAFLFSIGTSAPCGKIEHFSAAGLLRDGISPPSPVISYMPAIRWLGLENAGWKCTSSSLIFWSDCIGFPRHELPAKRPITHNRQHTTSNHPITLVNYFYK